MQSLARRLVADRRFERLIIALIVFNGVLVGLETSHAIVERFGRIREEALDGRNCFDLPPAPEEQGQ